jgi:hypothetical protein
MVLEMLAKNSRAPRKKAPKREVLFVVARHTAQSCMRTLKKTTK